MTGPPLTVAMWLLAVLPIVLLFAAVLSGKLSTPTAAALVVAAAVLIAALAYRAGPVLGAAVGKGTWLGLWILGVVWPALLLYRVASSAGLDRIGHVFASILPRRRERLLMLAWLFPSFLQGVAGFGTPIAISAPLLVAAGWSPATAVVYPLIGYHWSVTFGSMGSSYYMASLTAHLDSQQQVQFASRSALLLAVNCVAAGGLVLFLDGGLEGLREGGRMLLVVGAATAVTLIATASIVPAVASLAAATAGFVAVFGLAAYDRARRQHVRVIAGGSEPAITLGPERAPGRPRQWAQVLSPYLYLLLTALPVFLIPWSRAWVHDHAVLAFDFPATTTGYGAVNEAVQQYTPLAVFAHPGFYVLLASLLGYLTYRCAGLWPDRRHGSGVLQDWLRSLPQASISIVLLACVATIMADAGMVSVLARGVSEVTGSAFPALAPVVGGIGSFMTGSTTTSNALFSGFQRDVATLLDMDPSILLAAQTAGGNVGNALAPVVALIGLTAVGQPEALPHVLRRCLLPAGVLIVIVAALTLVSGWR